jgi:hypothetical protein
MVKKPKRPTKAAHIKEQLEKIVGHKIDESEQQLARFSFAVGSFAYLTLPTPANERLSMTEPSGALASCA